MRRGELAGLNWSDFDIDTSSLTIVRTRQVTMGRTVEGPVKTRTSRRRIDLDDNTTTMLDQWRQRLAAEGAAIEPSTPMFLNSHHRTPSPESFSQLFTRTTETTDLPRIRFHDLRHTHASLLSLPASPSRSSQNGSGTLILASQCTPTNHSYQAEAQVPPTSSPRSSTTAGRHLPSLGPQRPRSESRPCWRR